MTREDLNTPKRQNESSLTGTAGLGHRNTTQLKGGSAAPLSPQHPATSAGAVAKHAWQSWDCSSAKDTYTPEREDGGKGQKSGSCCLQAEY